MFKRGVSNNTNLDARSQMPDTRIHWKTVRCKNKYTSLCLENGISSSGEEIKNVELTKRLREKRPSDLLCERCVSVG